MKRIFDIEPSEYWNRSKKEILSLIRNAEGRTLMAETIVNTMPLLGGISNPETAAAFGANLITLNLFDFEAPFVFGYDDRELRPKDMLDMMHLIAEKARQNAQDPLYLQNLKQRVGRFIGVNLEPVPTGTPYPKGFQASEENLNKLLTLGFDYAMITANPSTGVTTELLIDGVRRARRVLGEDKLIIAGKMHAAGGENIYDEATIREMVLAGADIVLTPAPGTIPGMTLEVVKSLADAAHREGALVLTTIGTSQEGANPQTIEQIALLSKMAGADIQHLGDAGYSGMTTPENLMALSIAIRGRRHTYRMMAKPRT